MEDNKEVIVVTTVEQLIELYGRPRIEEACLQAALDYLNNPQKYEQDPET